MRVLVAPVGLVGPALLALERHEEQPGHVEGGEPGGQHGDGAEDPGPPGRTLDRHERRLDDVVLAVEARERRDAHDGEPPGAERDVGDLHVPAEPTEPAHVHLVVHAVHHGPGAEEHAGLEETVRQQMEDRERVADRAEAGGQDHVADLRHRRGGERLLDVVLRATDDRPEHQRDRADAHDDQLGVGRRVEQRRGPHDQVDARGHHGRGVDERGHRRRARHRVAEPGLQRELRRLAAGGEQEHQRDPVQHGLARALRHTVQHRVEADAAERREHEAHRDDQPQVTDAVGDERLLGGHRVVEPLVPEPDQQVRRQTDALPADEQQQVAVGQHEREHRRDEQVEVREEPAPVRVVLHVGDRVDVDQRADEGDEQHERQRQRVEPHPRVQVERTGVDPVAQVHVEHPRCPRTAAGS